MISKNSNSSSGVKLLISLSFLILSGCFSYSFKGSGLPGVETIHIEFFQDRTNEPELGVDLSNEIIDKFQSDNTLKVVNEEDSQVKLSGVVSSISDAPFTFDESEVVTSYKVTINVEATLTDIFQEKVMWRQGFAEFGTYTAASGNSGREAAINEAITKTTDLIFSQTFSGW